VRWSDTVNAEHERRLEFEQVFGMDKLTRRQAALIGRLPAHRIQVSSIDAACQDISRPWQRGPVGTNRILKPGAI
jgi:hypothetical protein